MARFNASKMDDYVPKSSEGGKTGFFSLKDDKDTARVRFLYEGAEDIEGFSVHPVQVGDKERYVNCLREYNEPIDNCPFCKARMKTVAKMYVPLYNEDAEQIQFWERGRTFYSQISSLVGRYKNIVSRTFDIERNGAKGDTSTRYSFYPVDNPDGTTVQDIVDDLGLDKLPSPLGSIILDKSASDMEEYLAVRSFPSDEAPIRRRGAKEEPPFDADEPAPRRGRRTPARGTDTF